MRNVADVTDFLADEFTTDELATAVAVAIGATIATVYAESPSLTRRIENEIRRTPQAVLARFIAANLSRLPTIRARWEDVR